MGYKYTKEDFIKKANQVHNFKYNYAKVNFINSRTPVVIICPEHGEFQQKPNQHLYGFRCRKCADSTVGNWKRVFNVGDKIGRLEIISYFNNGKVLKYKCLCSCGVIKDFTPSQIRAKELASCGCFSKEK